MDYKKWMDKIKETNDQINKNWEDIFETCKKINEIVRETYGLTNIKLKMDNIYELQFSGASTKLIIKDNQYEIPISDDLDVFEELEGCKKFYQFVFQWHKNKPLYEEKLEEFLNEWFNEDNSENMDKNSDQNEDADWLSDNKISKGIIRLNIDRKGECLC